MESFEKEMETISTFLLQNKVLCINKIGKLKKLKRPEKEEEEKMFAQMEN